MNSLPHANGTLADALANGEFQEEQRNSEQDQADKVRNEECTWMLQRLQSEFNLKACFMSLYPDDLIFKEPSLKVL